MVGHVDSLLHAPANRQWSHQHALPRMQFQEGRVSDFGHVDIMQLALANHDQLHLQTSQAGGHVGESPQCVQGQSLLRRKINTGEGKITLLPSCNFVKRTAPIRVFKGCTWFFGHLTPSGQKSTLIRVQRTIFKHISSPVRCFVGF